MVVGQSLSRSLGLYIAAGLALLLAACSSDYPAPVIYTDPTWKSPELVRKPDTNRIAPRTAFVKVQKGDTLYSIAKRSGVPLRSLIEINRLQPPYTLSVDQVLRLPGANLYQVRKGDTLYSVSRSFGVDMTDLARLNNIRAPYTLNVGQNLKLPYASEPVNRPKPTQAQEDLLAKVRDLFGVKDQPKTVKKQDSKTKKQVVVLEPPKPRLRPDWKPTAANVAKRKPEEPTRKAVVPVPGSGSVRFTWPVRGQVVSKFGSKRGGQHNDGINIAAKSGAGVKAAEAGVVAYVGSELKGFGNLVLLKHRSGWMTAYAHIDKIMVKVDQPIKKGQKIATIGKTGAVTRPQLHFEIRKGKKAVNPLSKL